MGALRGAALFIAGGATVRGDLGAHSLVCERTQPFRAQEAVTLVDWVLNDIKELLLV